MGYSSVRANPGIVFYSVTQSREDVIDHEKVCKGTLSPEGETWLIMRRYVKVPSLLKGDMADHKKVCKDTLPPAGDTVDHEKVCKGAQPPEGGSG